MQLFALGLGLEPNYSGEEVVSQLNYAIRSGVAALMLLSSFTLAQANAAPPEAAAFFATPAKRDPSLSPSGRYASMIWRQDDKFYIGIADLNGVEGTKFFSVGKDTMVISLNWLTDDRLLAEYTDIEKIDGLITYTDGSRRMSAFDRDGGNPTTLFSGNRGLTRRNRNLSTVTHYLYDDPDHVLMPAVKSDRLHLYKVNVNTGKAELVEKGSENTIYWFANYRGDPILRVDVSDYGSYLSFFRKASDGKGWEKFKRLEYQDLTTIEHWPLAFGQEPTTQYVRARVNGEDRFGIYLYDVEKDEYLRKVFDHPEFDIEGAVLSSQGTVLAGIYYDDRLQIMSDQARLQGDIDWLNQQFGNDANVMPISMSSRHSRGLVFVSSPTIAGDYYLFDRSRRQLSVLFQTRPDLGPGVLSATEIMSYQARDGLPLKAYVTHPHGNRLKSAPLIVMPHGGPETRDNYDYDPFVQFLASRGYRVVQPNFRGSGGFGRAFAEKGYGEWGGKMQDDVTDAVQQLIARGIAQPGNMCIVGISYGGYAALYGGLQSPDLYRCAVSIAGVSDLFVMLEEEKRYGGNGGEVHQYWLKSIGDPVRDRDRLLAKSPRLHAQEYQVPVLLMHGEDDGVVYRSHSIYMERALKEAGKSVEYIEIEDEGHPGWKDDKELVRYQAVERFLNRYIPVQ
ncbi:MAG: S9 family peptidase [Alphaproteobacteria bacterium]|nr:MAG: S9 family peptidase [Alphaproteobacteria bacterium]